MTAQEAQMKFEWRQNFAIVTINAVDDLMRDYLGGLIYTVCSSLAILI